MKPIEILSSLPAMASASPAAILGSPAFAMPCRYGDEAATLRPAAVRPADTLPLSILFGDTPHVLALARSPRFPELDALWDSRADVPDPILLALAEKECGPLFQLLENAVRRQLRLAGMAASADAAPDALALEVSGVSFTLTRSTAVESALGGNLRHLDLSHPDIRAISLPAETEYAAFALPAADLVSLAPGDALLLPEIGTVAPRLLVDGRFAVDASGVLPFADDARCRVVAAEPAPVSLGALFDAADGTSADAPPAPSPSAPLRLVLSGKTLAAGRLDRLGEHPAFLVETADSTKLGGLVVG
jgi:hypothetical protein